jgi:hypothetical protein
MQNIFSLLFESKVPIIRGYLEAYHGKAHDMTSVKKNWAKFL